MLTTWGLESNAAASRAMQISDGLRVEYSTLAVDAAKTLLSCLGGLPFRLKLPTSISTVLFVLAPQAY